MNSKIISIEITDILFTKYRKYMDSRISNVYLIHTDEDVILDIIKQEETINNLTKQTIIRTNLNFIVDDPEISEEPLFTVRNTIEKNLELFLELSPYNLINITDLFSMEAQSKINKKYNIFGKDF